MSSFNLNLDAREIKILKWESILVIIGYLLMIVVILDTMRVHRLFRRGEEAKGFNVFLFYFLSLLVCSLRIYSICYFFEGLRSNDADLS